MVAHSSIIHFARRLVEEIPEVPRLKHACTVKEIGVGYTAERFLRIDQALAPISCASIRQFDFVLGTSICAVTCWNGSRAYLYA